MQGIDLLERSLTILVEEEAGMASSHVKKQITQETFNDVVCENVNDFDMSPEDAVNDAIQQFEAQGRPLSISNTNFNTF